MKKIGFSIILLLLIGFSHVNAQTGMKALRFSVLSEASTLPSYKLVRDPLHPGASVGLVFWDKKRNHWNKSLTAELGYYYQRMSEHAIMFTAIYTIGYKTDFGLMPTFLAGIGYKHSILPGEVYAFEDGEYVATHHKGQPQATVKLGLGLEYRLTEKVTLTSEYTVMAAGPYALMPASLHNTFSIGTKIILTPSK